MPLCPPLFGHPLIHNTYTYYVPAFLSFLHLAVHQESFLIVSLKDGCLLFIYRYAFGEPTGIDNRQLRWILLDNNFAVYPIIAMCKSIIGNLSDYVLIKEGYTKDICALSYGYRAVAQVSRTAALVILSPTMRRKSLRACLSSNETKDGFSCFLAYFSFITLMVTVL